MTPKEFKQLVRTMKTNGVRRFEDGKGLVIELADRAPAAAKPKPKPKPNSIDVDAVAFEKPLSWKEVCDQSQSFQDWCEGGIITQEVE